VAGWVRDDGAMRGVRLHETLKSKRGRQPPIRTTATIRGAPISMSLPEEGAVVFALDGQGRAHSALGRELQPARKSVYKGHLRVATATME